MVMRSEIKAGEMNMPTPFLRKLLTWGRLVIRNDVIKNVPEETRETKGNDVM